MNQFRRLAVSLAIVAIVVFVLWMKRPGGWFGAISRGGDEPAGKGPNLASLSFLSPNKLLATVGSVNLRSEDLLEVLQKEFHGSVSHSGLSNQDIVAKANVALDRLIEDELLAEGARRRGMKTDLTGSAGREDLAHRYLALTKIPEPTDADLRTFYKNHGEKFYVPAGAQVRELFLPLQESERKPSKVVKTNGATYSLGKRLVDRIRSGESIEDLAKQHVPEHYRDKAQVRQFQGDVMSPEDESKVLALRPGEVAGPIRVEGGYAVFQCVAQIRSGRIPFYEAQEKIRKFLVANRFEDTRKRIIAELGQQISVQRFTTNEAAHSIASAH